MTDEELASNYADTVKCEWENDTYWVDCRDKVEDAFLAGLKAGKEDHSKIYMLGRKDERERPCSLCKNPISICVRCERRKHCEGSDTGAYVSVCEDFIYKEMEE